MISKQLRQKSDSELKDLLVSKREELRQLRFGLGAGKVKNVRKVQQMKKDIARILTVINAKVQAKRQ